MSSSDEEEASVRRKREDTVSGRREDDGGAIPERKVEVGVKEKNSESTSETCALAEAAASKPIPTSDDVAIKEEPLNTSSEESAHAIVPKVEVEKVTSTEIEDRPAISANATEACDPKVPEQNATSATTLATIKTEMQESIEVEAEPALAAATAITKEEPEAVCEAGDESNNVPEELEEKDEIEEEEDSGKLKTAAVPDLERDVMLLCAETLVAFSARSIEVIEEVEDKDAGLDLLAEGAAIRDR